MFKDSRVADRQRTASTFDKALERYAAEAESWAPSTLTVDAIDRRLAQCDRLLHSARSIVARFDIADSHRYLDAVNELTQDRVALTDLRYALLTGASDREDVQGPPGWRTAKDEDWNEHHPKTPSTKLKKRQTLAGTDQRWVTLEAAKFVAANQNTLDDSHELATRAHNYARVKTSTFTPDRSAGISEAFVEEVVGLQQKAPRLRVASASPIYQDFPDEFLHLG